MPAQQRRWSYHEPVPAPVREQSSKRGDERTIGGSKPRALLLASQDRELVPQEHQFHVLGELGSATADEQPQNSSKGKVREGDEHRAILPRPANALTTDSSCAVQRFLIFARARETRNQDGATTPGRERTPKRPTRSRINGEDAKGPPVTAESMLESRIGVLTPRAATRARVHRRGCSPRSAPRYARAPEISRYAMSEIMLSGLLADEPWSVQRKASTCISEREEGLVFVPSSGVAGAVVAVEPDHKHNRFPGATGELLS